MYMLHSAGPADYNTLQGRCVVSNDVRVPNRLRVARATKGYTQQELADRVGVTRQTIGLIEREQYNPTISLCLRLASVLGTTLDDLFMVGREGSS